MSFSHNTRKHISGYGFHFFRAVAIRVSCTNLTGAKENNEYQGTAVLFITLESFNLLGNIS